MKTIITTIVENWRHICESGFAERIGITWQLGLAAQRLVVFFPVLAEAGHWWGFGFVLANGKIRHYKTDVFILQQH
jgi:hypothetical protein